MAAFINASTLSGGGIIASGDSSGILQLQTGGTTAVTVDGSQNVGIGTSSPSSYNSPFVVSTTNSSNTIAYFENKQSASGLGEVVLAAPSRPAVRFHFITSNDSNGYFNYDTGAFKWFNNVGGSATQSMTLDSNGNLLVGLTTASNTPSQGIAINPNSTIGNIGIGHATGTSNGSTFINFCYNGSQIGTVFQATTSSVTYQTTSDYRLKENVTKLSNGLSTINSLNPVTYTWIKGGELDEGFIAHELQQFIPHAVSGEKDQVNEDGSIKPQGVDYGKVVPFLVAAIQEQQALITQLTTRIAALEGAKA